MADSKGEKSFAAWARLYRLALAPTVLWDVSAGYLLGQILINQSLATPRWASLFDSQRAFQIAERIRPYQFFFTAITILLIFHGGMALNDWADRGLDAKAGRNRPIPKNLISPRWALLGGLIPIVEAGILAGFFHPEPNWILALIFLALLYNLGGSALRRGLGPLLLSLCRSLSFSAGILILLNPEDLASSSALWAVGGYALYVLFLSRMASKEEEGGHGMNMLPFIGLMALSPLPFLQMSESTSWVLICGWLLLSAWLLYPALPDRHIFWVPERVQAAVRRSLTVMPILPALALVAAGGHDAWLLAGIAIAAITVFLASKMAPE